MEKIETVIVGGGQAGLSTSFHLKHLGHEHVVLEQAEQAGNAWRNDRWDSFTLVTPNWSFQLPGAHYDGEDPDGYMPKDEIVKYFERYVETFNLPVQYGTTVTEVAPLDEKGYRVMTDRGTFLANQVIMATGSFQKPKIPEFSRSIPHHIKQLHSGQYRNPAQLPDGAVLVIGGAQSGLQIAEELYQAGRRVFVCTCSAPRLPRRYRGRDIVSWLVDTGFWDQTQDKLPSPKARLAGNPQVTGKNGGHTLNLHQFARDGVTLLGHVAAVEDGHAYFKPDLVENLARSDKAEKDVIGMIDRFIQVNGMDVPRDELPNLQDGYAADIITSLDLEAENITTIIWAMGYASDDSLVKLPLTDDDGFPLQERGITRYPGLFFVGTNWLYKRKSVTLLGMNEDVEYLVIRMLWG